MTSGAATYEDLQAAYEHMRDMCRQAQEGWNAERGKLWAAEARIAATRRVIEHGYERDLKPGEKCEHNCYAFEDCIGCYDEALWAALGCDSVSDAKHEDPRSGAEPVGSQSGGSEASASPKSQPTHHPENRYD